MKDDLARLFAGLKGHLSAHKGRYWLLAGITATCILLLVASLLIVSALPFNQGNVVVHTPVATPSNTSLAPTLTAPPTVTKTPPKRRNR